MLKWNSKVEPNNFDKSTPISIVWLQLHNEAAIHNEVAIHNEAAIS